MAYSKTWFKPGTYYARNRDRLLAAAKRHHHKKNAAAATRPKPAACELCGDTSGRICFDHCHKTGVFRGWVCYSCNILLGRLDNRPEWVERAQAYVANGGPAL